MKNLPKVTIITFAYNSEKYIIKCADSILNQTFNDIEWIVLDNGSTDSTGDILLEYQKRDSRVKLYRNKENSFKKNADYKYENYYDLIPYVNGEYFTALDSDDFFESTFIEEMYRCAKENDSDIVICGNNFIEESTNKITGYRMPPNFSGNVSELCHKIPKFYACLRPMWEKLYKTQVWKNNKDYLTNYWKMMKNGADTFFTLKFLQVSDKISALNKVLHNYIVRENSVYNSYIYLERWKSYDLIFIEGLSLLTKHSAATPQNISFLANVHINSLIDLVGIAQRCTASANEKIQFLLNAVNSPMLSLSINYISNDLIFKFVSEFCKIMWSIVKEAIVDDSLNNDLKLKILDYLTKVDGKEHIGYAIMIGKILSASIEDANKYIEYSKMLIAFFIENNKFSDAKNALMEIFDVLPDDPDLIQYSNILK